MLISWLVNLRESIDYAKLPELGWMKGYLKDGSQNQHAGMRITAFSIDHAFGF